MSPRFLIDNLGWNWSKARQYNLWAQQVGSSIYTVVDTQSMVILQSYLWFTDTRIVRHLYLRTIMPFEYRVARTLFMDARCRGICVYSVC